MEDAARLVPATAAWLDVPPPGDASSPVLLDDESDKDVGGDWGDMYGEWAKHVAEPVPFWTRYKIPEGGIWFHDLKKQRFFIPEQHGIYYNEVKDAFMTDDSSPTSGTWLLEVDALGESIFHNTRENVLSFYYSSCRNGEMGAWQHMVERVDASSGRSQTRPVGFRDNANGQEFALADVGTRACNWNQVFYNGIPYWINVDPIFFQLMKNNGEMFREDECETVEASSSSS